MAKYLLIESRDPCDSNDNAANHGIDRSEIVDGPQPIAAHALPELLGANEQVWHW